MVEKTIKGRNSTSTEIIGLEKFTKYEIAVTAFNKFGEGNKSVAAVCRTKEDGELK